MAEFRTRLHDLLEEFAGRPIDLTEPAWSLFVALHPDPNRPEPAPTGADLPAPDRPRGPSNGPASTR
jgi:hypothetical protein